MYNGRRGRAWAAVLLVVALLAAAGLACGEGTEEAVVKTATPAAESTQPGTQGEGEPAQATEAPTEAAPPTAEPKLGDVVEVEGISLSAVMVEDPAAAGDFYTPEEGTKLVAVEFVVGCGEGCETLSVNPLNAHLVDGEGFAYGAELAALGAHDQIETVEIGTGERVKGWVGFEVPERATPAYLKYEVFLGPSLKVGLGE